MADYDNTNKGAAFVNDKKTTDKHPDMRGSLNVDGVEYWISFWWATPNAGGAEFLRMAVNAKEEKPQPSSSRGRPQPKAPADDGDSDDIPF